MSLIFLKLGGSLITDKDRPFTPRPDKLNLLASEIASALRDDPDLQILLGHGSGSFGHAAASRFDTRAGVSGAGNWQGFTEVWYQASALNRLVLDALRAARLPTMTFSAAASVTAHDGKVFIWDSYPIHVALTNGLLPVVHGDVAFDEIRGGTILSTEDLFAHLALALHPQRILLAGLESGVWADFPSRKQLVKELTPGSVVQQDPILKGSVSTDVTGGMLSKVSGMLDLVEQDPNLEICIFSGDKPGNLRRALQGENLGTCLHR